LFVQLKAAACHPFQHCITQNGKAIIIPVDSDAAARPVMSAGTAGIPLVAADGPSKRYRRRAGLRQHRGRRTRRAEHRPGIRRPGHHLVTGTAVAWSANEREHGFREGLK
jgi:hypothetical protein